MDGTLIKTLLETGGAVSLAGLALWMWRLADRERRLLQRELREIREAHTTERNALVDRHVATVATWQEKYYELAEGIRDVLSSFRRERERKRHGADR